MLRHQDEQKRIRETARSSTMKNLVALLCLISALLGPVFSYTCKSCYSPNATRCNKAETECLGDKCMTASQLFDKGEKSFKSLYKGCANNTLCGTNGTVSPRSDVLYRFHVDCCTGNKCNTAEYYLPKEDPAPNGKICPSAFCTNTTEECKSDKMMNCTGSMDRCVKYIGEVRNPDKSVNRYSLQDCANYASCKNNFDSAIGMKEQHRGTLICYEVPS